MAGVRAAGRRPSESARVALADRQERAAVVEAIRADGGEAISLEADIADERACEAMVRDGSP